MQLENIMIVENEGKLHFLPIKYFCPSWQDLLKVVRKQTAEKRLLEGFK